MMMMMMIMMMIATAGSGKKEIAKNLLKSAHNCSRLLMIGNSSGDLFDDKGFLATG